jgi:hypothetical protein
MKFGEIYTYKNADEARQFIGKKGVFSDSLREISDLPEACDVLILREIEEGVTCPFAGEYNVYQFFRPILKEDEPLMTHRQLAEWLAKGHGEYILHDNTMTGEKMVSHNHGYLEGQEDEPVEAYILIRRWKDTEWVRPTKAIYEEASK